MFVMNERQKDKKRHLGVKTGSKYQFEACKTGLKLESE